MDCVHIFRAEEWDDALQRAIVLGREHEKEYRNAEGHAVRWRLMEVVSLDLIRSETLDGAEVHSTLTEIPSADAVAFDATFNPEESRPVQTF